MRRLRIVIVDDEMLARSRLRRLLAGHDDVEVVGEYASGGELLDAWPNHSADLVLLDVRMPGPDGLAIAGRLQPMPLVIFVTAFAEHALQAFDVAAIDYLLKPVEAERLDASLQRARERLREVGAQSSTVAVPKRLTLSLGRRNHLVDIDRIDCIIAQANYIELHANGRRYLLRKPLQAIAAELDPAQFVRVHRSVLVRIAAVRQIEAMDSGRHKLHLEHGEQLSTGRSYAAVVRERFGLNTATSPRLA